MKKIYSFLLVALASSAYAQVTLDIYGPEIACPESCTEFVAQYTGLSNTTQYSVNSIFYNPPFPITGGTVLDISADDTWSPIVTLPFNFSFYGTNYNQLLVGSNGVITFDLVNQQPLGGCNWMFSSTIPNTNFSIKNAIFGVYQDNDTTTPSVDYPDFQNVNYYLLDTGLNAAPNRVFVANFNELPQYQCVNSMGLQTSQIVIHESTNIIEVFVAKRTPCVGWNDGSGLIGLLNATGENATVPPGRNTGAWSANYEAWRFTPSGETITPTISWFENGSPIGEGESITVCPTTPTNYSATLTYDGSPIVLEDQIDVTIFDAPLGLPVDMQVCGDGPYVVDLNTNMPLVLGAVEPLDYMVTFHHSMNDAIGFFSAIETPNSYTFTNPEIIYMRIENIADTGCVEIKPFTIEGIPTPDAPIGSATQVFTAGQTLANLIVNGQNIQWYDEPTNGNLLPINTPLVDGTTYYASQTIGGCESRMMPGRLAVTAVTTLGTVQFRSSDIRLYPNPAEQTLTVSLPQNIDSIEILNVLGQTVSKNAVSGKEIKLDVSALSGGSYFLKIYSGNQSVISRFIKK